MTAFGPVRSWYPPFLFFFQNTINGGKFLELLGGGSISWQITCFRVDFSLYAFLLDCYNKNRTCSYGFLL
ncbi:hypothetical protein CLOSTMETH_02967 [[Clostridium] methylpentosum DSM 5476]|uniref:Uncharacterized protein n=1 Tax=[Clostridium] methylpentosum DSM 5476 TaxID=537013 RepID=C0EGH3_9FIRM|nr:hypothetical protein CLOSTMETH_02967 [[Clostridium] methylpentosum DSM 5476]